MRRVGVAAVLAAGLLMVSGIGANACATYCEWDPVVLIVTPGGHVVPVFDSVWTQYPTQLGVPLESYTVSRAYRNGTPVTIVDMKIYVAAGLLFKFPTTDEVTTGLLGSGTVLASAYGSSGTPVELKFTLPVS